MSSARSNAKPVRVRGAGFDITEVARAGRRTTFEAVSEASGARVARIVVDSARGRPRACVQLLAARDAPSLRALAAPLARLLGTVGAGKRVATNLRDRRSAVATVPAATRALLARALGRRIGARHGSTVARAIARDALDAYGRERSLAPTREPSALGFAGIDVHGRAQWLESRTADAWRRMQRAAAADGLALELVSAFRSIAYQWGIVARKLARGQALDEILRVNAAPGYSEHHTGRAIDVTTPGYDALEEAFERSPAFAWLRGNAHRFGFSMSYPRGNPHGIAYEPWHWRFDPAGPAGTRLPATGTGVASSS